MKECQVEGCPRPHRARGMCTTHVYRFDRGLPLDADVRQYERAGVCKLDGCERRREGHVDLCNMHLRRKQRRGEVGSAARERAPFGEPVWSESNYARRGKLLREYGLTADEYDRMLTAQGGGCAICGSKDPRSGRARANRSFCVDHDHETGHVRGLLCSPCNRGIGMLGDDPAVIEAALRYVRLGRQIPLFGPAAN